MVKIVRLNMDLPKELRKNIHNLKERISSVKLALETELDETKKLRAELKELRNALRDAKINSSVTVRQNNHIATLYGAGWIDQFGIKCARKQRQKGKIRQSEMKQK